MSIRTTIPFKEGVFFITFTCYQWLPLFEMSNGYSAVYKWFSHLEKQGHFIAGYVIIPNHFHGLLAFRNTGKISINNIVSNGKRFIAYDIIRRLKQSEHTILAELSAGVKACDARKGKLHEVFMPSFEWKVCDTANFTDQTLLYIHNNPCHGKWKLAENPCDYPHSSAAYYLNGTQGIYPVTNYSELEDVDLTIPL